MTDINYHDETDVLGAVLAQLEDLEPAGALRVLDAARTNYNRSIDYHPAEYPDAVEVTVDRALTNYRDVVRGNRATCAVWLAVNGLLVDGQDVGPAEIAAEVIDTAEDAGILHLGDDDDEEVDAYRDDVLIPAIREATPLHLPDMVSATYDPITAEVLPELRQRMSDLTAHANDGNPTAVARDLDMIRREVVMAHDYLKHSARI